MNEQVMGMLQNNAGNPDMVRRIAEENQLSPTDIAQALKIPEEAAARYMPEPVPKPGMAPSVGSGPAEIAGAASNALGSAGAGMSASPVASPMGQMADTMQKPMAAEPPPQAMQKPAKLPADMKPQGMEAIGLREEMGRPPGGNPALPRLPAFGRGRSSTATQGEQAFVEAFNRLRGNLQ